MAKITFETKLDNQISELPSINKVAALDMNEIKSSVNQLYDDKGGFAYYQDLTTETTPIVVAANTWVNLTNDKAGPDTLTTYKPSYVSGDLWNSANNTISLNEIPNGKIILLRTDFNYIEASSNQHFDARIYFPDIDKELHFLHLDLGSKHLENHFVNTIQFYVDSNIKTSDVKIQIKSSGSGTAVVNSFLITVLTF
jgi:hypothetical protein